jgi:hypothetical protein
MVKNYLRILGITVISVASASMAQAQKNFRPGFIVQLSGDTLRGEVDSRGEQRMSTSCLFRTASDPTQRSYVPTDLKAYGFTKGARYESCLMPAASAPTTLFLQVLAQGKSTLYTHTDEESRTRYFFRINSGTVVELEQTVQKVQKGGITMQEQAYPFRQTLSQAFSDCFAVQPMLSKAVLSDSKLVAIFDRYNTCDVTSPAPTASAVRVGKLRFGVVIGGQRANSTLEDAGKEVEVKSSLRSLIGMGLLFHPASFNNKLAFRLEALYQTQVLKGDYERKTLVMNYYEADISLKTLRVPIMLRYTLLLGKVQPYIQAGVMTSLLLNSRGARIIETNTVLGGTGTATVVREMEMRGLGIGPTAAIGLLVPVRHSAVQIEARYDQLDSASQVVNKLAGPKTTSLLLGYNF